MNHQVLDIPLVVDAPADRRPVSTRPSGDARPLPLWLTTVLWLLLAVTCGLAAGRAAELTGLTLVGLVFVALLLGRVELAALTLVAASLFEGYLSAVSPFTTRALAVVVIGAWAIRRTRGRLHASPRSPVLWCALGLAVVLLVSSVVNLGGPGTVGDLARWAGFLAVLVVLADCMRAGLSVELVARVYVAASAVAALCGIVAYALGVVNRVGGPLPDPNELAFFLVAALPLSLSVRRHGRRTLPWDVASVVIGVALLGTFSRGAFVGLAVMLVFAILVRQIGLNAVIGILGVALTIGGLAAGIFPDQVHTSLTHETAVAGQRVDQRYFPWQSAERMTLQSPVVGHGPGSFATEHATFDEPLPLDAGHTLDVAHNTYLQIAAETGLLGLAAFLAVIATGFWGAWRCWRRTRAPVAAGVTCAFLGALVAATFLSEMLYLPLWLLAAMGVGLAARVPARPAQPSRSPRALRAPRATRNRR